jgi:hypothetical protein
MRPTMFTPFGCRRSLPRAPGPGYCRFYGAVQAPQEPALAPVVGWPVLSALWNLAPWIGYPAGGDGALIIGAVT